MGAVGGSRHYDGPGIGRLVVWECPGCGVENSTPFEQGCPKCGAGKPGRHVGDAPPRAKLAVHDIRRGTDPIDEAFYQWVTSIGGVHTEVEGVMLQAWRAAVRWIQKDEPQSLSAVVADLTDPTMVQVPRLLIEQVITQLDNVVDLPDGQQSAALLSLIAQLKETLS